MAHPRDGKLSALYDAEPGASVLVPVGPSGPARTARDLANTAKRMGIEITQRRFLAVAEATSDFGVELPAETMKLVRVVKVG